MAMGERALVVMNAAQTTFIKEFLMTEFTTMKEAGISERLTSELKGFLGTEELVSALQRETRRLHAMHKMSK